MSTFDPAALAALQKKLGAKPAGGAKAPIRRKVAVKAQAPQDDKKLQTALKKLNVQPLAGVEEVNMFKDDGVLHFKNPRVHAAAGSNTLAVYGHGVQRELTDLMPSVLNQLGPDTMASLRKIAEQYQAQNVAQGGAAPGAGAGGDAPEIEGVDGEDVPELVEASESKDLEDVN